MLPQFLALKAATKVALAKRRLAGGGGTFERRTPILTITSSPEKGGGTTRVALMRGVELATVEVNVGFNEFATRALEEARILPAVVY